MSLPEPLRSHLRAWLDQGEAASLDAAAEAAAQPDVAALLDGDTAARLSRVLGQLRSPPVLTKLSDPSKELTDDDWDDVAAALAPAAASIPARAQPPPQPAPEPRRRRWWPVVGGLAMAAAALLFVWSQPEPALLLVTPEEAALAHQVPPLRGAEARSQGPAITQVAPDGVVHGPFLLDLRFQPGNDDVPLDPGSLQIRYLRGSGLDITDRLRPDFDGENLRARVELPPGEHTFDVFISDEEQRGARLRLEVSVE